MTPTPHSIARAAHLLVVLLVALPALTGLVVCVSDAGVTTSWGERPCPRKGVTQGTALTSPDDVTTACVVVPDTPDAPLATSPDLRALTDLALPALVTARMRPVVAPVAFPDGPRGPPSGTLRALRTTVLRV